MKEFAPAKSNGFIHFTDLQMFETQDRLKNYVFEQKLDGSRYLWHLNKGKFALTSRRESAAGTGFVNKIEQAYLLKTAKIGDPKLYGTVLDGEVMAPGSNHSALTEIIGSLPDKAIMLQKHFGPLRYFVFDILQLSGVDLRSTPFSERRKALELVVKHLQKANDNWEIVVATPQFALNNAAAARVAFLRALKAGNEGLMIKEVHAAYGKGMYKWKVYRDGVAIVTGYEEGEGKYRG